VVGDGGKVTFEPLAPEAARPLLARVVALSVVGTRVPIPLFLDPCAAYMAALAKNAGELPEELLRRREFRRCLRKQTRSDAPPTLSAEEELVFRGMLPPDGSDQEAMNTFHAVAVGLFQPLRELRRKA